MSEAIIQALRRKYMENVGNPARQLIGGGVRGYLGLDMPEYADQLGREAYANAQALSNAPGIGAPAGAFKAAAATPLLVNALRGKTLYHGSPRGPIVGQPKISPHDETGIPGFSVSRSKEYAQSYADDVYQRHWDLEEINPTMTKFKLKGRVVDYMKFMDRVRKEYKLTENDIPSHDQIFDYAKKRGVVGFDYKPTLNIDEISVLYPEALRRID